MGKIAIKLASMEKPKVIKGEEFSTHRKDEDSVFVTLRSGTKELIMFHRDELQYIIWDVDYLEKNSL